MSWVIVAAVMSSFFRPVSCSARECCQQNDVVAVVSMVAIDLDKCPLSPFCFSLSQSIDSRKSQGGAFRSFSLQLAVNRLA